MEDFPIADSLAGTCKAQRLDGNVQPELVSILETINYRARDAVDANGNAIDGVRVVKYGDEKPAKHIIALHVRNVDAELLPSLLDFVSGNQQSVCKSDS